LAASAAQAQYTYTTNADGVTLTISRYSGPGGAVSIPATNNAGQVVVSIGEVAFVQSAITSVTIPGSITNIGAFAFQECVNLTNITIPGNVTDIGESAFQFCTSLASVTLADGVASIETGAFAFCDSLTGVNIPASVTNIGAAPFEGCDNLATITVDPQNLFYSSVNGVLFDEEQTTLEEYPAGLAGNYAIPGTVTNIGESAFLRCTYLTGVMIPDSVTIIGDSVFDLCSSLTNATIPCNVISIGQYAFNECKNLAGSVTIPGGVSNLGEAAFNDCPNLNNVLIANGVASIGALAFESCVNLTNATISASVTNIGEEAFSDCFSLASVFFAGKPPALGAIAFSYDSNMTAYYLPGAAGWSTNFAGHPAVLWNPLIQAGGPGFGLSNGQFGFNITGTTNIPILVEACADLASPVWIPLQSGTLTNGLFYFSETYQTGSPGRFYRIRSP
jgi:hypothetical protein